MFTSLYIFNPGSREKRPETRARPSSVQSVSDDDRRLTPAALLPAFARPKIRDLQPRSLPLHNCRPDCELKVTSCMSTGRRMGGCVHSSCCATCSPSARLPYRPLLYRPIDPTARSGIPEGQIALTIRCLRHTWESKEGKEAVDKRWAGERMDLACVKGCEERRSVGPCVCERATAGTPFLLLSAAPQNYPKKPLHPCYFTRVFA